MLKIIMGAEKVDQYKDLIGDKKIIWYPNISFKDLKKKEWFRDPFVHKIIKEIDNSTVICDYAIKNDLTDTGYSVDSIAGGSKSLILTYEMDRIVCINMGDNCTDLLEQIAIKKEQEGEDLLIIANYLLKFNFNYVDSIYYVNWDITCHSNEDIIFKIMDRWFMQEREGIPSIKDDDDDDEDDDYEYGGLD